MTPLTAIGLASLVFVVGFTTWALRGRTAPAGRQTARQAVVEVWINLLIGMTINAGMNWLLLPLVGASISLGQNLWLGISYTAVSLVRSFVIRRYFEQRIHYLAGLATGKLS
jgi:hypothetical protein